MTPRIDIEDMTDAQDEERMTQQDAEMPPRIWANVVVVANGQALCGEWNYRDVGAPADTEYVRADLARPSQAGDERVAWLVEAARCVDLLPPGEWETWTSCSFRRITAKGGPDGGVLSAITQRSDGHPDLSWNERQCRALCDLVNGLRAALAAMDTPKGGGDE